MKRIALSCRLCVIKNTIRSHLPLFYIMRWLISGVVRGVSISSRRPLTEHLFLLVFPKIQMDTNSDIARSCDPFFCCCWCYSSVHKWNINIKYGIFSFSDVLVAWPTVRVSWRVQRNETENVWNKDVHNSLSLFLVAELIPWDCLNIKVISMRFPKPIPE